MADLSDSDSMRASASAWLAENIQPAVLWVLHWIHISYIWITEHSIVPPEYRYIIRMISWFNITLGLMFMSPVIAIIIYDITLWLYRLFAARNGPHRPEREKSYDVASFGPVDPSMNGAIPNDSVEEQGTANLNGSVGQGEGSDQPSGSVRRRGPNQVNGSGA
ncbi:hypothetical protein B0T22DRAFT_435753 [Podospora appendiculata]|uniref:Uncharacterized protein n=1 Tax=Podospora appendiculata TaxID=314037 RepID=A0AAE0XG89_9PEZI|nr:hypothetical protein B0T22DRAFT_435753 [Podospora appendiculata]